MMHAAKVSSSPRLKRVLAILADGKEHSTREIVKEAEVMAVSACVAELRQNGATIICVQKPSEDGQRLWFYTMTKAPKAEAKAPKNRCKSRLKSG